MAERPRQYKPHQPEFYMTPQAVEIWRAERRAKVNTRLILAGVGLILLGAPVILGTAIGLIPTLVVAGGIKLMGIAELANGIGALAISTGVVRRNNSR